jgi:predicted acyltransferase (DUF342 family)
MRQLVLGLGLVAVVTGRSALAAPPTDAMAYAVLGTERVTIGAKGRVQGDVGCLSTSVDVGAGTKVTGAAAANAITLGRNARISGGLFCGTLDGGTDACMALPSPLVATPTIVLVGAPSNTDVSAAKRSKSTTPLASGVYGRLSVGAAAEMTLAGGTYQFESIDVAARGKLLCRAACDVTVRGRIAVGQATQLGAAKDVAPSDVVFRIAGQGASTGFAAKSRARMRGSIYAPNVGVTIGSASSVAGAIVGGDVSVGSRARLAAATAP